MNDNCILFTCDKMQEEGSGHFLGFRKSLYSLWTGESITSSTMAGLQNNDGKNEGREGRGWHLNQTVSGSNLVGEVGGPRKAPLHD